MNLTNVGVYFFQPFLCFDLCIFQHNMMALYLLLLGGEQEESSEITKQKQTDYGIYIQPCTN